MGRVILVGSQKGGVGKTTTALNLGYSLSRLGSHVIVVDADPQGSLGIASNLSRKTTTGFAQVLSGECLLGEALTRSRDESLAMLGSGVNEADHAMVIEDAARDGRLGAEMRRLAEASHYVLVDAPAGVGSLVRALLEAADGVLIPVRCQNLYLKSLPAFLRLVQRVKESRNPSLEIDGAVVTLRDERSASETALYSEFVGGAPEALFFKTVIRHDEIFEKASQKAVPVAMLPGAAAAARAYLDLAFEYREREAERGWGANEEEDDVQGLF